MGQRGVLARNCQQSGCWLAPNRAKLRDPRRWGKVPQALAAAQTEAIFGRVSKVPEQCLSRQPFIME